MANVMLTVGLIVGYGYAAEAFFAWFSGDMYERYQDVTAPSARTRGRTGR